MAPPALIRPMVAADLAEVAELTNAAFAALHGVDPGTDSPEPIFPQLLFQSRLAADPAGCLTAATPDRPQRIAAALFSVARRSLGWFGPLAVSREAQGSGLGQQLVGACVDSWRQRGVRLMGLETFGGSPFHVHLYGKMGFRPAWTGISFTKALGVTAMPQGVELGAPIPDLSFIYPGLDISGEAAATAAHQIGASITTADGAALCHLQPTFQPAKTGYLPFVAARTRRSFDLLLEAAEHLSRTAGCTSILTRVSGSSWSTQDALSARGYRAGEAMVRMKSGADPDYDRGEYFYCDNWL